MVNLDDTISLVIFVMFFAMSITYFSTLNRPDRIELESLASDIAGKILKPEYLGWNATKTSVFVNASSTQNLYPIDMRIEFPNGTKSNSVRAKYHQSGKDVGFIYANASAGELVMLANLSAGKNIIDVFYSDTDASAVDPNSDLNTNGLLFSNSDLDGELSSSGDVVSISYRNGDNEWLLDRLFIGTARYQASSYTVTSKPLKIQYDFTNGSTTKTYKIYAFNPIIRVNISAAGYTWNAKFAAAINRTFANSEILINGSDTLVFSGVADFIDMYASPGSTTNVAFSDKNINAAIYDGASYRELNISNSTASVYEMYYHSGSYNNAKPYNEIRLSPGTAQLGADYVSGIKASKISDLNGTGYAALKQMLGASKDFHIQIENSSDGTLLLDYGLDPPSQTDVVVSRKTVTLLTTDYDFQKMILRVKTWN